MNRKGFTLIELIAVVFILSLILVIAAPNITSAYKNSRLKSEEIFIGRLSDVIDSYVKLNTDQIGFSSYGEATKEGQTGTVTVYQGTITVNDIISSKIMLPENYINAGNKEKECNRNAQIEVYKDSDYVYCYKVKKESLGCLTDAYKNSITGNYVIDTCVWRR